MLCVKPYHAAVQSPTIPCSYITGLSSSKHGSCCRALAWSTGAADCASCVAVLLEIARVLVSDPSIALPGPVLFLFNGGEESLMQAAHGFVHSGHRWVTDIGVFINLEATGSGGPDTLFQHTAGWTAQTYAAAAKYPRGSVFLQVHLLFLILLSQECT